MELLHKLENTLEEWFKPLPHLPADWRKWLADNAWWLTIISAVVSVIGIFSILSTVSRVNNLNSIYNLGFYYTSQARSSLWMVSEYISILFLILTTFIAIMAIKPLQDMNKFGWDLLFMAMISSLVSGLVVSVLSLEMFSVVFQLLCGLIGSYFLIEFRSYFKSTVKLHKK